MGIREYFEKQPKEKDLKLQDLNLDIQETRVDSEFEFDPEKEISETDWENILAALESYRKESLSDFYFMADELILLFPDRVDQLNLDETARRKLLEKIKKNKNWVHLAAIYKTLFPEHIRELIISKENEHSMFQNLEIMPDYYAMRSVSLKILFPEKVHELHIEQKWEAMKKFLERFRKPKFQAVEVARLAANMKILSPDRFKKEIKFTEDEKRVFFQQLIEFREIIELYKTRGKLERAHLYSEQFCGLACNLKILAADHIETTNQGIKLISQRPDLKTKSKTRPVRKNF